jgi:hypothetical protein
MMPSDPADSYGPLIECLLNSSLTIFGRLVSVAALRDSQTDTYRHPVLAQVLDQKATNKVLRREHRNRLLQWLALTLPQQRGDLCRYFDAGDSARRSGVRFWLHHDLPALLIPTDSLPPERSLFLNDVKWILESIRQDVEPEELRFEVASPCSATTRNDIAVSKDEKRSWFFARLRSSKA